ncbi:MAG: aminotransferase class I/II-fold pyridoxal phosphate-dependent enzyme, partial [Bacteroidota bacterium]
LSESLLSLSFVKRIYPSSSNFLLVKFDNAKKRYQALKEQGIIVRDRSNELHCENCLRITVGTKEENEILLQTLKQMV